MQSIPGYYLHAKYTRMQNILGYFTPAYKYPNVEYPKTFYTHLQNTRMQNALEHVTPA